MTLLRRGFVKSVQLIDKWVILTKVDNLTTLQVDVNQVDPTKSIVLYNDFKIAAGADPSNNDVTCFSYVNNRFELHAIENRCVKFTIADKKDTSHGDYCHVVFQLVEFY